MLFDVLAWGVETDLFETWDFQDLTIFVQRGFFNQQHAKFLSSHVKAARLISLQNHLKLQQKARLESQRRRHGKRATA